jgi:hypothetical protein
METVLVRLEVAMVVQLVTTILHGIKLCARSACLGHRRPPLQVRVTKVLHPYHTVFVMRDLTKVVTLVILALPNMLVVVGGQMPEALALIIALVTLGGLQ